MNNLSEAKNEINVALQLLREAEEETGITLNAAQYQSVLLVLLKYLNKNRHDDEFEARVVAIVLKAIKGRGRIYREILTELQNDLSRMPDQLKF